MLENIHDWSEAWQTLVITFRAEFEAIYGSAAKRAPCYYTLANTVFYFYFVNFLGFKLHKFDF